MIEQWALTSEFPGIDVIIFYTIRGPSHLSMFEARDASNDALLHVLGHTVRDAVGIDKVWTYRRIE